MKTIALPRDDAFTQVADQAVRAFCPDIEEVTYIDHGYDNLVLLVNHQYTFRFPRTEDAAKRLAYETALLQKIGPKVTAAPIPELVYVHTQPLYVVSKYLPGEHLDGEEVQKLTEEEQVQIGRTIADFIVNITQSISGPEIKRLREEAMVDKIDDPWDVYFKRLFEDNLLPNEKLRPVVEHYYGTWKEYVHAENRLLAIHDDIHPANLLFVGPRLSAVLDFGDANQGSVEEEMRGLYFMGDIVLREAAGRYQQLTGQSVNLDHVRVWSVMQQLAAYTDRLARQQSEHPSFIRARANLKRLVPDFPL